MTERPPCSPHGWTLDTLEKHLTSLILALQKEGNEREERNKERFAGAKESVSVAMASAEKAISKAEIATDKRLDGVNELRGALSDQTSTLLPRSEYSVQHGSLVEKIDGAIVRLTQIESQATGKKVGLGMVGSFALGAFAILASIAAITAAAIAVIKP
jgi:hypothetical protein